MKQSPMYVCYDEDAFFDPILKVGYVKAIVMIEL